MNFKKKYGQNFLLDQNILTKIIELSEPNGFDVVEIGPGSGNLTKFILDSKPTKLISYEIDSDLIDNLEQKFSQYDNFNLINQDFLKAEFLKDLDNYSFTDQIKIIANLPYNISSKIIFSIINNPKIISINIMLQKELVDRINATKGTKNYGRFCVAINSFFIPKNSFFVSRNVFVPIPNVDSSFIRLDRNFTFLISNPDQYLEFIKISFSQRRKTLLNNVKLNNMLYIIVKNYLIANNLKLDIRADNLTIKQFKEIWYLIEKENANETK